MPIMPGDGTGNVSMRPGRGRPSPKRGMADTPNAKAQREAARAMSDAELLTGYTADDLTAQQRAMKVAAAERRRLRQQAA